MPFRFNLYWLSEEDKEKKNYNLINWDGNGTCELSMDLPTKRELDFLEPTSSIKSWNLNPNPSSKGFGSTLDSEVLALEIESFLLWRFNASWSFNTFDSTIQCKVD